MNAELIHEHNENLKKLFKLLEQPKPKPKKTIEERAEEYEKRIDFLTTKRLLKNKL